MHRADKRETLHEPLTEREREIVNLIAGGLTNQQIAAQLYLTLDTVKWYNRQIYQKLGVHTRTQAIAAARESGLLGEPFRAVKHNLPEQGTVFIGREQELADIQARLADGDCRLLTLLGPGGIGKTRLALEAARRQIVNYPDGVYLVQFAPVESPAFLVQALADGLGLALTTERNALDQVIHFLREKTLLLLLDNFEHLLEGVDLLAEVLARAQAAKLLVTSRERLHLKDEWLYDVQGLRYPASGPGRQKSADLAGYEAGQLFLATARRAQSDFAPDENDLAQVARICRLVGGMPLGIELAASWVRLLSCSEIAHGIAQNLDMLTTSWRDVPERHRSIQAVLDHSWQLLAAGEQEVFRKLAVFSDSFRPAAAAAVADASLTLLLALVDKSFLRRTDHDRFYIHELVKQYGSGKLQADPELLAATRLRHCVYHAAFLIERMEAPDAGQHLGVVEAVFDDMQAAWRCAVENRQLDQIGQLAAGFLVYYRLHGWYRAGSGALAVYRQALACFDPGTQAPDHRAVLACLYESLGELQKLAASHGDALVAYEKALETATEDDLIRRGRLYGKTAEVYVGMNRHELGHEYYTLAETVLARSPLRVAAWWNEWLRIKTLRMELYYWRNRPDDMAELARQIGTSIEQYGSTTQRVRYLYLLGMMAVRRDRYFYSVDAIDFTGRALALSLETGNLAEVASRHFFHGFCHLWSNHLDKAETHLQIARAMTEQNGDITLLARALTYLAVVYRKRDQVEHVREYAAYALRIAGEAQMPQYIGMARAQYAWLAWRAGKLAETRRQAGAAIEDWGGLGTAEAVVPFRWLALFPLLGVALQEEDMEQAVRWAQHVITLPQQRLPDELAALLESAVAAGESGSQDVVRDRLHDALQLARKMHYI
jgi:predicted ATPase/DNA-binding CsgD family transcriptional regulator